MENTANLAGETRAEGNVGKKNSGFFPVVRCLAKLQSLRAAQFSTPQNRCCVKGPTGPSQSDQLGFLGLF